MEIKVGDWVPTPKKKSIGNSYELFLEELSEKPSSKPGFLLVTYVTNTEIRLDYEIIGCLGWDFLLSDLEPEPYQPPKTIAEARIRMIQGEKFKSNGAILFDSGISAMAYFSNDGESVILSYHSFANISEWLPYTEEQKEPEFPFKDGDKVCAFNGRIWTPIFFCKITDGVFHTYDGLFWRKLTAFDIDLVGTSDKPKTPVWIMRDGKPVMEE